MKQYRIILSLFMILLVSRAYSQKVTVDYDHKADFQGFKTYAWTKGTPLQNQLWDQRIVEGVDQQLQAKGLSDAVGDLLKPKAEGLFASPHNLIGSQSKRRLKRIRIRIRSSLGFGARASKSWKRIEQALEARQQGADKASFLSGAAS